MEDDPLPEYSCIKQRYALLNCSTACNLFYRENPGNTSLLALKKCVSYHPIILFSPTRIPILSS